jgi:D-lactate dehydrogenase (cytochrome)
MVAASRKPAIGPGFAGAHAELVAVFGDRLSVSQAIRDQHCNTTTWVAGTAPDAVAFPRSVDEAQRAVRICTSHGLPIIPWRGNFL